MNAGYRQKNILGKRLHFVSTLQFMCKNIKQHFGVRISIDMPKVFFEEISAELFGIRKITIVSQG